MPVGGLSDWHDAKRIIRGSGTRPQWRTAEIAAQRQICAAVQTHRDASYIFAGSKTPLLTEMTSAWPAVLPHGLVIVPGAGAAQRFHSLHTGWIRAPRFQGGRPRRGAHSRSRGGCSPQRAAYGASLLGSALSGRPGGALSSAFVERANFSKGMIARSAARNDVADPTRKRLYGERLRQNMEARL
jgi:hypothetical protein